MPKKQYEIAFEIGGKLQASLPKSIYSAAGQLDRLGQKITALEKTQGTSTRFRALHNEIDATKLKLRQAEGEVKHLGSIVGPMTADMARRFSAAKANVEALRLQFRGQVTELKGVKSAMDAAGISTRTFAADNAKLAASMAKAQKAQAAMRANLGARAANAKQREEARAGLGQATRRALVASAGVAAFALPAKVAARFEDSMATVGALARASDEELARLTDTARKLGRDTRFSATSAAEGMGFLAQAGFSTNQVIAAMPGMLNIAAAGSVDLGTAADITSNILKGFGMQAGESSRLGDVLTNTFTQSNTNLAALGDTMKYVAPIAKATGVSLEMTAAAAGILGDAGIKGEQAGTALRAMLSRLAAPARRGRVALAKLGVKTKDARGNLLPLADVLAKMSTKLEKYGTGVRQAAITHIFGMEAATAATVLLGSAGSGALQKFTKTVARSGTAAEIAAKKNATMTGQWDNIAGSVEDVGIQIGYMLIPTLKRLIDRIVPVINSITEWLGKHPQLTEAIVVGTAALATLVLGLTVAGVAFAGAKLAILGAQGAMLLLNAATWKAVAAFIAVHAPLMLWIAGIAGLIAIGWQLVSNWKAIEEWWDKIWDSMFDKVADIVNKITPILRIAGFDVQDMDKGVLSRARYSQRLFGDLAKQGAAYQPWTPGGSDTSAPSWLKKSDQLKPGASGKGDNTTINQTINIPPGTPDSVKKMIESAGAAGLKDMERAVEGVFEKKRRLALAE